MSQKIRRKGEKVVEGRCEKKLDAERTLVKEKKNLLKNLAELSQKKKTEDCRKKSSM